MCYPDRCTYNDVDTRFCQYKRGNAECADDAEWCGIRDDSVLQDRQHGVRKFDLGETGMHLTAAEIVTIQDRW